MKKMFSLLSLTIFIVSCSANPSTDDTTLTAELMSPPTKSIHSPTITSTPIPSPTQTPEAIATVTTLTPTEAIEEFSDSSCTELGCSSSFQIYFEDFIPDNFLLEVVGDHEEKIIFHCFEPDQGGNFPYSHEMYSLDSPELDPYKMISAIFNKCDSEFNGKTKIVKRADNSLDQIIVFCGEWADFILDEDFTDSDCMGSTDTGALIVDYPTQNLPKTVTMIVSWENSNKHFEFQPDYISKRPNGPDCEPECFYSYFPLTLP